MGLPLSIDSDQGRHFTGKALQDALQLLGVTQKFHISYHPQSSGQVERLNRQIKTMLWKFVAANGKNWNQLLPLLLMCIRAAPSSASKVTPYEVMTDKQMRLPEHLWYELGAPLTDRVELDKYVHDLQQNIQQMHTSVAQQLGCSQKKAKRYFDQSTQQVQWNIGDKVLVFGTPERALCHKWEGPYFIVDKCSPSVYKVHITGKKKPTEKWFHTNQLKLVRNNDEILGITGKITQSVRQLAQQQIH
uniref:Integrase catalytic domain-containing protein n=1 Tax=Latimeria chalumnae TaxID=7897 RepID=H3AJ26_LATCH